MANYGSERSQLLSRPGLICPARVPAHRFGELGSHPILMLLQTLAFLMLVFVVPQGLPPANASEPALVIASDTGERRFRVEELLQRTDCVSMRVNGDIYHNAVEYRAVPLLALLDDRLDGRRALLDQEQDIAQPGVQPVSTQRELFDAPGRQREMGRYPCTHDVAVSRSAQPAAEQRGGPHRPK